MSRPVIEFDLANERVVIATMVHDPEQGRRLAYELKEGEFGDPRHKVMFRGVAGVRKAGLDWNEDTFASIVAGSDFGGFSYLRAVVKEFDANKNLEHHVGRLRVDAAKYILLKEHLPKVAELAADPQSSPFDVARELRAAHGLFDGHGRRHVQEGEAIRTAYFETLRGRVASGGVFEPTGFEVLDAILTVALAPGGLTIVVGRPRHGKTTFAANMLRRRLKAGRATHLCAWEMGRDDYLDMMVSAETGIEHRYLTREITELDEDQRAAVGEAVERFTTPLLTIEENPFASMAGPANRFEDVTQRNLDVFEASVALTSRRAPVIVVDVIGKALWNRTNESITAAMVRLRERIAKRYGVHLVLLHHLNRTGAEGPPTLESIKDSGAFEEEADNVLGIDRPILRASPGRRRAMGDVLDVYVLKQRKGAPACVRHEFDGKRYRLSGESPIDLTMLDKESGGGE